MESHLVEEPVFPSTLSSSGMPSCQLVTLRIVWLDPLMGFALCQRPKMARATTRTTSTQPVTTTARKPAAASLSGPFSVSGRGSTRGRFGNIGSLGDRAGTSSICFKVTDIIRLLACVISILPRTRTTRVDSRSIPGEELCPGRQAFSRVLRLSAFSRRVSATIFERKPLAGTHSVRVLRPMHGLAADFQRGEVFGVIQHGEALRVEAGVMDDYSFN